MVLSKSRALPVRSTSLLELMRVLHQVFNITKPDHVMLWAACCLGFFGFLWVRDFIVNSFFNPVIHLSVDDIQDDSLVNPSCLKVHI